ncbi:hypothetical protein [Nodosilinea nodulosa]|uniref:hypothetical protein n=1 Tax=Nodosilinea nodulosa TaxID=416001 RepID=UPI00030BFD77|nr:hypothetical protein [Nodosilinea nodulosa]
MINAFVAVLAAILGLGIVMGWPGLPPVAAASHVCREVMEQQLCIETIKRSAKYPWEYRVVVSVDGKSRPLSRYDCRQASWPPAPEPVLETAPALSETAVQQFICDLVSR